MTFKITVISEVGELTLELGGTRSLFFTGSNGVSSRRECILWRRVVEGLYRVLGEQKLLVA